MLFKGRVEYIHKGINIFYSFSSLEQLMAAWDNSNNQVSYFSSGIGGLSNKTLRTITKFVLSKETIAEIQKELDLREK